MPLKIAIIGDVDNGKSTLIGQILYSSGNLFQSELDEITNKDTSEINLASVSDGLKSEREKKITIDVSHKFLNLNDRRFIFYDCPGHVEYMQNTVTACSNVSSAMILIDSRKGLTPQLLNHIEIVKMMSVKNLIFCINKMDLFEYDESVFKKLEKQIIVLTKDFKSNNYIVPISAKENIGVLRSSELMSWFEKDSLLENLLCIANLTDETDDGFYLVQKTISSSTILGTCYDLKLPQNKILFNPYTKKEYILKGNNSSLNNLKSLTLDSAVDIKRGHILVTDQSKLVFSNAFTSEVYWLAESVKSADSTYKILFLNQQLDIKFITDTRLSKNQMHKVKIETYEVFCFAKYVDHSKLGRFVLVDNQSYDTVGFGFIKSDLPRACY
jgi:bifunctional enzyme CysN/CysC